MKYFLVLGIEYKFFKNPADITIHVGDKFVDAFRLTRDHPSATNIISQIETQWYNKFGEQSWLSHPWWIKKWAQVPSLFKVYEIDDSVIEGKLKIKVENSHNDFTNGFMKNNSLIKFSIVSLIKKDLVENRGEKMMKTIVKFGNAMEKFYKRKGLDYEDRINPPSGSIRTLWLNAPSFWVSIENEKYEKSGVKDMYWWLGGSFTAEFIIKTKHRMKVFAPAGGRIEFGFHDYRLPKICILATCKQLLNIYDEDQ